MPAHPDPAALADRIQAAMIPAAIRVSVGDTTAYLNPAARQLTRGPQPPPRVARHLAPPLSRPQPRQHRRPRPDRPGAPQRALRGAHPDLPARHIQRRR